MMHNIILFQDLESGKGGLVQNNIQVNGKRPSKLGADAKTDGLTELSSNKLGEVIYSEYVHKRNNNNGTNNETFGLKKF